MPKLSKYLENLADRWAESWRDYVAVICVETEDRDNILNLLHKSYAAGYFRGVKDSKKVRDGAT